MRVGILLCRKQPSSVQPSSTRAASPNRAPTRDGSTGQSMQSHRPRHQRDTQMARNCIALAHSTPRHDANSRSPVLHWHALHQSNTQTGGSACCVAALRTHAQRNPTAMQHAPIRTQRNQPLSQSQPLSLRHLALLFIFRPPLSATGSALSATGSAFAARSFVESLGNSGS